MSFKSRDSVTTAGRLGSLSRGVFVQASMLLFATPVTAGVEEVAASESGPVSIRHFYVYNETNVPINTTVEFVPLYRPDQPEIIVTSATLKIPAGSQTMLCTTNKSAVLTASISDDGKRHWAKVLLESTSGEYTHVVSTLCDRLLPQCAGYPPTWPNALFRQLSDEESNGAK